MNELAVKRSWYLRRRWPLAVTTCALWARLCANVFKRFLACGVSLTLRDFDL